MIRKVPNIDSPIHAGDIVAGIKRSRDDSVFPELEAAVSRYSGCSLVSCVNSGITALYVILKALAASSRKREVVLPAYTAGSLVVAVRKAGLIPVLCDISLADFNNDPGELVKAVSDKTAAVVCIHMFGIPMSAVAGLREKLPPGVSVIEDCAQAMGGAIGGRPVGSFGDVAFFSFNRGKNLPVGGGGAVATNDAQIAKAVAAGIKDIPGAKTSFDTAAFVKTVAVSAALNPYVYGILYGLISRFKENAPPLDFSPGRMSAFHAALAVSAIKRFDLLAGKRHENGMFVLNGLKGISGVVVPEPGGALKPAFNRFPVMFKDRGARDRAASGLWRAGIESSRMYQRPLHHMFDLGYTRGNFPNACAFADGLLTVPVHPSITRDRLQRAVDIIRGVTR